MGSEADRSDLPRHIAFANRLQRVRIDLIGEIAFLERVEMPGMEHGGRVRRAHVRVGRLGRVRVLVAVAAEDLRLVWVLQLVAIGIAPNGCDRLAWPFSKRKLWIMPSPSMKMSSVRLEDTAGQRRHGRSVPAGPRGWRPG